MATNNGTAWDAASRAWSFGDEVLFLTVLRSQSSERDEAGAVLYGYMLV
jgi:hypothetical protein